MSAVTAAQRPASDRPTDAPDSPAPATEPTERLWEVARSARSLAEFYSESLRVLAERFDSPFAAVTVQRKSDTIHRVLAANESAKALSKQLDELQLDARYRTTPIARVIRLESLDRSFALIASPLSVEGEGVVGSVGVVTPVANRDAAEARLGELKALASLLGVLTPQAAANQRQPAATEAADQSEGLGQAARYRSASEYAYSLTNGLKTKLGVAQASLGLVRGRRVEIVCISGFDRVEKQAAGVRTIQQAMDECRDVGRVVVSQSRSSRADADYLLHKAWRTRCGDDAVACVPLGNEGDVTAVVALQHRTGESFDAAHLEKVREKLTPIVSGLLLLRRSERPLGAHLGETLRSGAKGLVHSGPKRLACLGILAAVVLWALFAKQAYVLSAPATLHARDVRQVAAPFAGAIEACHVKPGARVEAGQPLVDFDVAPLEAEQAQAQSQRDAARSALRLATGVGDLAAAAAAHAEQSAGEGRLRAIEYKLARARIAAPATGVVLSGEVTPRVGESVPLGEPLLELATGEAKRIDVFVDESAATLVTPGQPVRFAANARPSTSIAGTVVDVDASSTVHEARNAFRVRVELDTDAPAWAIAGMEGIARVETAAQPVWWVWCHGVFDAIQIQWWKL